MLPPRTRARTTSVTSSRHLIPLRSPGTRAGTSSITRHARIVHDPYVKQEEEINLTTDLEKALEKADCIA
ncbi:hypothetical protein E4H04_09075, partial [Candidatus Bathyarchaeota archaeon]